MVKPKTIANSALQIAGLLSSYWLLFQFMPKSVISLSSISKTTGFDLLVEVAVLAPYLFLALLFLSKPVNFIGPITGWLDRRILFGSWSVYRLISTIMSVGLLIFILSDIPSLLAAGQNPLTAYYFEGHWLSWVALSLIVVKFGLKNLLKGIMASAFLYGSHELTWFVSSAAQFSNPIYTGESFSAGFLGIFKGIVVSYMPLAVSVVVILLTYFLVFRVFTWKRELLIFMIPALWGAIQLMIGFPNTLELGLGTKYFNTWWVNLAEVMSWALPAVVALWPDDVEATKLRLLQIPKSPVLHYIYSKLTVLVNMMGTMVIAYFGYRAVGTAIASNSLIQRVQLSFIWGGYDPVIFMVIEDVAFFFIFYKKFYPKNIYMFMFLWGSSDVIFNAIYDAFHLPQLISNPQYWQIGGGWTNYAEIMAVEGLIGVVGLVLLKPKFDLCFGATKYVALAILVGGYLYSFVTGYNVISDPTYSSSASLYILNFIENTGLLAFAYSSIRPAEEKLK